MTLFMNGAIALACLANGLFFLRFWKNTRDPLFGKFAISFWLLAVDQILLMMLGQSSVSSPAEYLPRLAAFLVIIVAIVEKNKKRH
jgi:hypothetical protein